jgi:hypothetical protein
VTNVSCSSTSLLFGDNDGGDDDDDSDSDSDSDGNGETTLQYLLNVTISCVPG